VWCVQFGRVEGMQTVSSLVYKGFCKVVPLHWKDEVFVMGICEFARWDENFKIDSD
jgi:hypothetical protein